METVLYIYLRKHTQTQWLLLGSRAKNLETGAHGRRETFHCSAVCAFQILVVNVLPYSKSSFSLTFSKRERCKGYFLLEYLGRGGGLGVGPGGDEGRACRGRCLETVRHNLGTR